MLLINIRLSKNGGTLKFVPDCYKYQDMYNEAVDNYPYALQFLSECYKTKKSVIKLSIQILIKLNMLLNSIRLKKCVI